MSNFENKWWYITGSDYTMPSELADWVTTPRTDNRPSIKSVVPFNLDPVTREEIPTTVERLQEKYRSAWNFDIPEIFAAIGSITPHISRSFFTYVTKNSIVNKHIHPPVTDQYGLFVRPRRTISVGIPLNSSADDVKDLVHFYSTTIDYTAVNYVTTSIDDLYKLHDTWVDVGEVPAITVEMPKLGKYLILDFNSSSTIHWTTHESDGKFLFLVCDY